MRFVDGSGRGVVEGLGEGGAGGGRENSRFEGDREEWEVDGSGGKIGTGGVEGRGEVDP